MRFATSALFFAIVFVLAFAQALIGANLYVVFALSISSLVCVSAILNSRKTGADVMLFAFSFYMGFASLIFKTSIGQSVDDNLVSPYETSSVLILASISVLLSYISARILFFNKKDILNLSGFFKNQSAINSAIFPISITSILIFLLHIYFSKGGGDVGQGGGFGGFGSFKFMINISLALLFASIAFSKSFPLKSWVLVGLLGVALLAASFLSNEKRPVIDFMLVAFLSFICFDKLRPHLWVLISVGLIFMPVLAMLAGALEATRMAGKDMSPMERADLTLNFIIEKNFNISEISRQSSQSMQSLLFVYKPNMSYYYPDALNIDRYSLIFPLDQIVRHDPARISGNFAVNELSELMPAAFVKKTGISFTDQVAWRFGIRKYGSVARPVIGLPASSFAIGGYWGVFVCIFLSCMLIFGFLIIFFGEIENSPLAIAISTVTMVMVEWDFARIGAYFFRQMPLMLFTVLILKMIISRSRPYRRFRATASAAVKNSG